MRENKWHFHNINKIILYIKTKNLTNVFNSTQQNQRVNCEISLTFYLFKYDRRLKTD